MSAPQSMARSASRRVCTWQMSLAPEALMRAANGSGSPNDRKTGARVACEHEVEQLRLLLQRPGDEAASDRCVAGRAELGIEPVRVAVAAADQPKPSGRRDGGGEPPARRERHGRGDDRMRDAELLRQPRVQCHVFGSRVACLRHATSRTRAQQLTWKTRRRVCGRHAGRRRSRGRLPSSLRRRVCAADTRDAR